MYYLDAFVVRLSEMLPQLLGAALALLIGWIIAVIVATIVRRVLEWMGIDRVLQTAGVSDKVPKGSIGRLSDILASLVKWIIIIGAVGIAADILNLTGVSAFTGSLLAYVPNVLIAMVILIIGFVTAQKISQVVEASTTLASMRGASREVIGKIARYGIIVFSIMAALTQLNIVPRLIEIAFAGLVFALALAFGLGGRDHASQWIENLKNKA